ncbi:MAG: MBL fold metallo-hydrolase [Leptospiraceae bacterium]|nr:MBL fold metallo-hydrolase [Leptospiraceae bacterium]
MFLFNKPAGYASILCLHFILSGITASCQSGALPLEQNLYHRAKVDPQTVFQHSQISVTHIDTATVLIRIGDFTILTDPVFDKPGNYYHHGFGAISKKTDRPAVEADAIGKVDLVLLSHEQHKDNLDITGRQIASKATLILTTLDGAAELPNARGLKPWQSHQIQLPDNRVLTITATPARHHPAWIPEFVSGPAIGFVLQLDNEEYALYITGDTVYFDGIDQVAARFKIGLALVHVGSAEVFYLTGPAQFTMDAAGYIQAIESLNPALAIPIHNNGWSHFDENNQSLLEKLGLHPQILEKTLIPRRGVVLKFGPGE